MGVTTKPLRGKGADADAVYNRDHDTYCKTVADMLLNDVASINKVPVLVKLEECSGLSSDIVAKATQAAVEFDNAENARLIESEQPVRPKSTVLVCLLFAVASLNVDGESRVTLGGLHSKWVLCLHCVLPR